jgi:transcriptional regulator with XRE-family HTH domain
MESVNYYVRQLLKKHRRARHLSLRKAGKFSGICFTTVNCMESGKHGISLDNLIKLAALYQVSSSDLLREAERLACREAGWQPNAPQQWQAVAAEAEHEEVREEAVLPA